MATTNHIQHYNSLVAYNSYPEAWVGPIVFPLSFAIVAQVLVYADMVKHRCAGRPWFPLWTGVLLEKGTPRASLAVEIPTLMHLVSETVFAIACFIQCATNWSARRYVGLVSACNMQGVYAGYYMFSATALTAISALAASFIISKPDTSRITCKVAVVVGVLVHVVAILLASLPVMGVGEYIFPRDFCMPNVESGMYSGLIFAWWLASALGCFYAAWRTHKSTSVPPSVGHLLTGIAFYFIFAWLPLILIILVYWADGSVAAQRGWVQTGVGLYGLLALVLHTNQLVIPLLIGWRLRAHMNVALSFLPLPVVVPIDTETKVEEIRNTPSS